MPDRYFVEAPLADGPARLEGAEAHHFAHVMRGVGGDQILVFDGQGSEWLARVDLVGRSEIALTLLERREVDRELPISITVGVPLPKGDRQRWLVEKLVELGATRLAPLQTRRSTSQGGGDAPVRLRRAAIEAAKQCGGNRLLDIATRADLGAWLSSAPASAQRFLAHPEPSSLVAADLARELAGTREVWFAVGPEGGFTSDEVGAAVKAGWSIVCLGPRLLRVETAALALVTLAATAAWTGERR